MQYNRTKFLATAAYAMLIFTQQTQDVSAHGSADGEGQSAEGLVQSAAFIFRGQVVKIDYRTSRPTDLEPNGVPHTFVTYKIEEVLRGESPGKTLTLRFPGGSDDAGGIFMETRVPTFARGQKDILFVKGGAENGCPIVECVDGRFRLADDRVYNGWGVPVQNLKGGVHLGGKPLTELNIMEVPRPKFERLIERPEVKRMLESELKGKNFSELKEEYLNKAPEFNIISYDVPTESSADSGRLSPPIEQFGAAMPAQEFINTVKEISKSVPESRVKVIQADPARAFTVPPPQIGRFEVSGKEIALDEEELKEMEALKEGNDGKSSVPKLNRFDLDRAQPVLKPKHDLKLQRNLPDLQGIRAKQEDESSKTDDPSKEGDE